MSHPGPARGFSSRTMNHLDHLGPARGFSSRTMNHLGPARRFTRGQLGGSPIELIFGCMAHFQSSSSLFSHKLSAWGLHILMAVGWRFVALQSSGSNDVEHITLPSYLRTFVPSYLYVQTYLPSYLHRYIDA